MRRSWGLARLGLLARRLRKTVLPTAVSAGLEGRLLRMAVDCGVKREEFLENYYGYEMDPKWFSKVKKLKGKGWAKFGEKHEDDVKDLREQINKVAEDAGLPLIEFRRIVGTVQKGEK